ncbi:hypothetical protein EMPS_02427 [Entomortierella parvispora]|uniref:F-box domain-containing protein n=1 Tax=Entomortierella parvispora TaxID=205924 RepID=A0A9P3H5F0_9FUNG|nr:hypothetical protein EMPS_02427 [Entomortierella parvispora]
MQSSLQPDHSPSKNTSLFEIPEILLLIARCLSSRDLSIAVRVCRSWHQILIPPLYRSIRIRSADAQLSLFSPEVVDALARYGHHTRVLYSRYSSILDLFREPEYIPFQQLQKIELADFAEEDGFYGLPLQNQFVLQGLALMARDSYEKTRRTLMGQIARSRNGNSNDDEYKTRSFQPDPEEPPYTYQMPFDPELEEDSLHAQMLKRSVQLLIHPPELNPFLNLLRINRGLRSLTIFNFPNWSEQAIRAICRENLPLLEELNMLSPRSGMISARLSRILLEGLSPRLKRMKFSFRNLHMDDPMTDEQRQQFWQRRRLNGENEEYALEDLGVYHSETIEESTSVIIPFLRRCHRLERLTTEVPYDETVLSELAWTLYENCPRLQEFSSFVFEVPDQRLATILLTSRRGWKKLGFSYTKNLGRETIMAIMGTGEQLRPRRFLDSTSTAYIPASQPASSLMDAKEELEVSAKLRDALAIAGMNMIVICPRLRFLEKIEIEGCGAFTSMDLQTILCSCPSLRILMALSGSSVPDTTDPILLVTDMKKPIFRTESTMESDSRSSSAGGVNCEDRDIGQSNWACLGLEILCLRIQCKARPDLRVGMAGRDGARRGRAKKLHHTRDQLHLKVLEESREDQRVVYRQLGQLKRLKVLRLGYNGPSNWVPDRNQRRVVDFLDMAPSLSDNYGEQGYRHSYLPEGESHCRCHGSKEHTHHVETSLREQRLMMYGSRVSRHYEVGPRYQDLSLEWSLDSGLGLFLRGARNIESIGLHQMATRIGMAEVMAMVEVWPKLKHLGLVDDRNNVAGGSEEDEDDIVIKDEDDVEISDSDDHLGPISRPTRITAPVAEARRIHLIWMREQNQHIDISGSDEEDYEEDEDEHWSQWN